MKKRALLLALLVSVVVSFLGCGDEKTESAKENKAKDTVTVKSLNKKIYNNITVEDLYTKFEGNSYRASDDYKDYPIGMIGKVDSVDSKGEVVTLLSPNEKMKFTSKSTDKDIKQSVKELTKGDLVLISGKVKKTSESEFVVDPELITRIVNDANDYNGGYSTKKGLILKKSEITQKSVGSISYLVETEWESEAKSIFFDNDGIQYELGNGESLGIYYMPYKKIKTKSEIGDNGGKEWNFMQEGEKVADYVTYYLSPERLTYTTSSEKINSIDYRYYKGVNKKGTVQDELYLTKIGGDNYVAIIYIYGETNKYENEVAFVLGSLKEQQ